MEIRVLRYFLTVVKEGSFSRAADMLFITQPTLSRQIAQLEDELGSKLFIRGKQLTLTDAGLMLRRRAEEMVELMDIIKNEFQSTEQLTGKISIGTGGLHSVKLLIDHLTTFRQQYPNITFDFHTDSADNIKEKLDRGLLDFALLLEPVEIDKYDYLRMHTKERWGVLMPASSPLAEKTSLGKADLMGLPLIATNRQSLQKEIANWLKTDWGALNIVATYNVITNVAVMVNKHIGYALTIEGAVDLYSEDKLVFRPLRPELEMTSVLAWKKFSPGFGVASKFLDYFKKVHFQDE